MTARLLSDVTGAVWKGAYVDPASVLKMVARGPMVAVLQEGMEPLGHMVVVTPIDGGFRMQDPGNGVVGVVDAQWVEKYVTGGVWPA